MVNVVVIGLGCNGLSSAPMLALHGYDINGVEVAPQTIESRARVAAFDPPVSHGFYPALPTGETIEGPDRILVLANRREFLYVDPRSPISQEVRSKILFDTRNSVDQAEWAATAFTVKFIGTVVTSQKNGKVIQ